MHPCIITLSASSLYLLALSLFSVPSVRLYLSLCVYLCVSLCLSLTLCLFVCMYCPVFCVHFSGDGCHAPLIIPHILLLFSPLYISYPCTTLSSCMVLLLLLPYPFFSFHAASLWCGCNRLESAQNLRRSDWRRPASDHLTDLHFTWRKTCMRRLATARRTTFRMSVYHRRSFLSCVLFLST